MRKSTPINQIRKEPNNSELVQNILNDMEHPADTRSHSPQQPQYQPQQQQQHQPQQRRKQQQQQQQQQEQRFEKDATQEDHPDDENFDNNVDEEYEEGYDNQYVDEPSQLEKQVSTFDYLMNEGKLPLLVVLLVVLSNLEIVNTLIMRNIPQLIEQPFKEIGMLGIFLKAFIAGVIFYIVKRFLF